MDMRQIAGGDSSIGLTTFLTAILTGSQNVNIVLIWGSDVKWVFVKY